MACDQWRGDLDRHLDGELPVAEAAALAAHLRTCAACSGEVLERVQLKRAVQMAGSRYTPSAELRNRIAKKVGSKSKSGIAEWWRLILVPALVLVIAAFFLTGYFGQQRAARQRIYGELADLHVSTLASSTLVDVVSSDRHTVKPWFQGRIPFTFNLPELTGSDFALIGGRVAYLEQIPSAHLIYQIRKHYISVFILPDRAAEIKSLPTGTADTLSFHMETWAQNGLRYFVIGDTSEGDLQRLSKLLRDAG
ncbi:MAG: zf-HC2 domain-containing protein [Candidatus Sulfotelmatobacter sp.]|jgi:anti-sigma factor RsiW